ncbi:uncharacterized protein LOC125209148 [Salvia hispanica]|uniref:uncharacterized protein LOC125209148 n=1 Tax=Salvia hispanica TaxID=49212 RepID=UPI0020093CD6|nr:uncharacterized protein LOC125209148 [Salvia hispanica]
MDEDDKITLDPNILKRVQYTRSSLKCYFFDWITLEVYWCKYYQNRYPPRKENNNSIPGLLIHQGVDAFRLIRSKPITSAYASIPAYVAWLRLSSSIWESRQVEFVIKCVNREKDPEGERRLKADVARSRMLSRRDRYFGPTCSLIECEQHFYHDETYYCCVLLYYPYGASLSSIMRGPGPGPHGFPKPDHILFILYKAVQALDALHRLGQAHGSICAAHIYITRGITRRVKLGFAASVVDLATDTESDSVSPYMPSTSVCRWAAAPEAYDAHAPTVEGDMWLLGITALELAYGGLRITSRRELESIVTKINVERRLPKKINETDTTSGTRHFPLCCLTRGRVFPEHVSAQKRVFSKGFLDLVVACLDFRPEKRPTSAQLLCHHAFKRVQSWHVLPEGPFPHDEFSNASSMTRIG